VKKCHAFFPAADELAVHKRRFAATQTEANFDRPLPPVPPVAGRLSACFVGWRFHRGASAEYFDKPHPRQNGFRSTAEAAVSRRFIQFCFVPNLTSPPNPISP
jgi:hypothetical protein